MDLSMQPAQSHMSGAMSTRSTWLNIFLTLIPSKHLFETLALQIMINGYATEERPNPLPII